MEETPIDTPTKYATVILAVCALVTVLVSLTILTSRRPSGTHPDTAYRDGVIQALEWCACMSKQPPPVNRGLCDREYPLPGIPVPAP
jgi:hypothetical protein